MATINLSAYCVCCPPPCASNPDRMPRTLTGLVTYNHGDIGTVSLVWNSDTQIWEFIGNFHICGNLYLRGLTLQCTGTLGVYRVEAAIYTTQLEQLGYTQWNVQDLLNTSPFDLVVVRNGLEGFGISGCIINNGDIQFEIFGS